MYPKYALPILITISSLLFFSFSMTRSYFTDSASSSNTFSTAASFQSSVPDVVINEIMWSGNNTHNSTVDEWIELKNTTNTQISLNGWMIEGAGNNTSPIATISAGIIPPNGYFLISHFDKTSTSSILDTAPDYLFPAISLDNDGEQLTLKKPDGTIIDKANNGPGWLAGSNTSPKKSMERNSLSGDGTLMSNWHTSDESVNLDADTNELATPKSENSH